MLNIIIPSLFSCGGGALGQDPNAYYNARSRRYYDPDYWANKAWENRIADQAMGSYLRGAGFAGAALIGLADYIKEKLKERREKEGVFGPPEPPLGPPEP